jgi:CelD/BcsL family acetyltransferase involved in cellulose biosynthesis
MTTEPVDAPNGSTGPFSCETNVITTPDALTAARAEWVQFLGQPGVSAGFFDDLRVLESETRFEDGDSLLLCRVSQSGALVALVPFMRKRQRVAVAFGLVTLARIPARVAKLPDLDFPHRAGTDPFRIFASVVSKLRAAKLVDLILVDSSRQPADCRSQYGFDVTGAQTTYTVAIKGDFEKYFQGLSRQARSGVRRKLKKFDEVAAAPVRAVCCRTPGEMEAFRGHLEVIWGKSWHGKVQRHHVPSLAYLQSLAGLGYVRGYVLFAGERPIATVLGYQYGGAYHYEAPAYDAAWQEHSPGIVLLYYVLKNLFESDPPSLLDFGFGWGQYKQVFGTDEEMRGVVRIGASARGAFIINLWSARDALFKRGKALLQRTGVPALLKRRVRGQKASAPEVGGSPPQA